MYTIASLSVIFTATLEPIFSPLSATCLVTFAVTGDTACGVPASAMATVTEPPGERMSAVIVILLPVALSRVVVASPLPHSPAKPSSRSVARAKLEFLIPL